eukprot:15448700-Alexandrium_andersonii.AAC.1
MGLGGLQRALESSGELARAPERAPESSEELFESSWREQASSGEQPWRAPECSRELRRAPES